MSHGLRRDRLASIRHRVEGRHAPLSISHLDYRLRFNGVFASTAFSTRSGSYSPPIRSTSLHDTVSWSAEAHPETALDEQDVFRQHHASGGHIPPGRPSVGPLLSGQLCFVHATHTTDLVRESLWMTRWLTTKRLEAGPSTQDTNFFVRQGDRDTPTQRAVPRFRCPSRSCLQPERIPDQVVGLAVGGFDLKAQRTGSPSFGPAAYTFLECLPKTP